MLIKKTNFDKEKKDVIIVLIEEKLMKAILKFFLGQESIDLEKMDLYELDKMLMERFDDSADIKIKGKYYKMMNEHFLKHPDRDNYKQPNGSIRIFLENDDGTPILEKRSFNNQPEEIVQKQIRVLYKKDIDNYTKYGMNNFLILRFQENPEELRSFLKKLFLNYIMMVKLKKKED